MNINSGPILFLGGYWLILIPVFWIYVLWWLRSGVEKPSASLIDVDISSTNHFYHPLIASLRSGRNKNIESVMDDAKRDNFLPSSFWFSPVWLGLVISLLIIALSQPVLMGERLPDPPVERDIVFLVDTSVSMQLKDYQVEGKPIQRMQLLHKLLDEFALKMQGERIAVIVFGENPYTLVPLTNDQHLIRQMLGRVTTTLAGRYSALGDALLMALSMTDPERYQTFILFTDAHASQGAVTPAAAADLVAEKEIPVFTVAIGSSALTKGLNGIEDNSKDTLVSGGLYQPVNQALLNDIAVRTKGKSYRVRDSDAMEKALEDILSQRQNVSTPKALYEQTPLYPYPLLLGLIMLLSQQIARLFSLVKGMAHV